MCHKSVETDKIVLYKAKAIIKELEKWKSNGLNLKERNGSRNL